MSSRQPSLLSLEEEIIFIFQSPVCYGIPLRDIPNDKNSLSVLLNKNVQNQLNRMTSAQRTLLTQQLRENLSTSVDLSTLTYDQYAKLCGEYSNNITSNVNKMGKVILGYVAVAHWKLDVSGIVVNANDDLLSRDLTPIRIAQTSIISRIRLVRLALLSRRAEALLSPFAWIRELALTPDKLLLVV